MNSDMNVKDEVILTTKDPRSRREFIRLGAALGTIPIVATLMPREAKADGSFGDDDDYGDDDGDDDD